MNISALEKKDYAAFRLLFAAYYEELDCEDDPLHLLDEYIIPDYEEGLLHIAVSGNGQRLTAFIIYQTDDPVNDWCFKDGCGDIREIYVLKEERRKGTGSALVKFAEVGLEAEGASGIYTLPTEDAEAFFTSLGYSDCGEYCEELDNKVFMKS